jgi:hypothetical protein
MGEERLDGEYNPFNSYAGYSLMAPCMRACEDYLPFNVRVSIRLLHVG